MGFTIAVIFIKFRGGTTDDIIAKRDEIVEKKEGAPIYIAVEYPERNFEAGRKKTKQSTGVAHSGYL